MIRLSLMTTAGCHLCDDAEELLKTLGQHPQLCSQFDYQLVEIAEHDQLIEQYGVRIPVITTGESDKELGWPFSLEQLGEWIYNLLPE